MYHAVQSILSNPYYVWHTAGYVIDYMKVNDNRWPTSWDDLRQANLQRVNEWPQFEVLKENVVIDWTARPESLVKAKFDDNDDQPAFRVIWLRNGKSTHWATAEPNRLIWDYLQKHKQQLPQGAP